MHTNSDDDDQHPGESINIVLWHNRIHMHVPEHKLAKTLYSDKSSLSFRRFVYIIHNEENPPVATEIHDMG